MFGILASTFRTATRLGAPEDRTVRHRGRAHWQPAERFDARTGAEIEAHLHARRRF
ncbi:hypothetical protein rosmuc_02249 [Roseovarius mucosus DSM 17069]|uniref:Uncharacterized protein n=1 Tax=Roseovarius mucosus DSM 17069 TaxID=1288298 RepID=A0A0A0HLI2_9RHOB|nr:hypothetical protein [Roseovarius mucosus]KGM87514.1 hypothetical protein rosmuc_02249 [Roseovarius mucosus DSM 17069]